MLCRGGKGEKGYYIKKTRHLSPFNDLSCLCTQYRKIFLERNRGVKPVNQNPFLKCGVQQGNSRKKGSGDVVSAVCKTIHTYIYIYENTITFLDKYPLH